MELSELQKKILTIVCNMKNPTYNILIQELNRDRITILNSCESLIKNDLIFKEKINPEHEKSKIIFKPTMNGEIINSYIVHSIMLPFKEIKEQELFYNLVLFIKQIKNKNYGSIILNHINFNLSLSFFDNEGQSFRLSERESITKGFKDALLTLMENNDYNSKMVFNGHSNKFLEKILNVESLKDKLRQINKNLNSTIQQLT